MAIPRRVGAISGTGGGQRSLALASSQFRNDRSEHVGVDGAEDEGGEADLLPSSLKLFDGSRRVLRKHFQRVRGAKRSRIEVGRRQVWRDSVADDRHQLRQFDISDSTDAKVAYDPCHLATILPRHQCERDRVCDVGRHRLSLRPMHSHHHRRLEIWPIEISQRRYHLTHLGQPLAA